METATSERRRAGIYVRTSRDRRGLEAGVQRQEAECRALAAQLGWDVVEVFCDNDISASSYTRKARPGYKKLLAGITSGRLNASISRDVTRLVRRPIEMENYISVCSDIPTALVLAGRMDLTTATGRMMARNAAAYAALESDLKSEWIKSQRAEMQAQGRPTPGPRPFGYLADQVTVHPVEGAMVADAIRRVLAGATLYSIVQEWTASGVMTTRGNPFQVSSLRQMLRRPRNAGLVGSVNSTTETVKGPAVWEPLIDRETWEALCAMLRDPSRRTHNGSTSRKLLGSFLYRCADCGATLRAGGYGARGQNRYTCARLMHIRRDADPIDEYVLTAVAALLDREGPALIMPTHDVSAERARLTVLRARSDELAATWADDLDMTPAQFKIANGRLTTEIDALIDAIGAATAETQLLGIADSPTPGTAFRTAHIDRQRAVIDALVEVRVGKNKVGQKGFHPHTMMITRRAATA